MTDLSKLKVSLTKHGAHKVARLLKNFPLEEIPDNTWGTFEGIHIDLAQAMKNLSAFDDGSIPGVWGEAQRLGDKSVDRLVFVAVSFSHHVLIKALQEGVSGFATGRLTDHSFPDRKSFTNFKNDIEELGFSTEADDEHVSYDLNDILGDEALPPLVAEIFRLKLSAAGWGGVPSLIDECIAHGFHDALAVPEEFFRAWLSSVEPTYRPAPKHEPDDDGDISSFDFKSGHTKKKTGKVSRIPSSSEGAADLLHNELQGKLYDHLVDKYGMSNIGTEVQTGVAGTSIDVVRKDGEDHIFYEIKTSASIKACIREALPQLLEYAYWPNDDRAKELVIVSPNAPTEQATSYLRMLRERYGLPVYYRKIDRETGVLSDPV